MQCKSIKYHTIRDSIAKFTKTKQFDMAMEKQASILISVIIPAYNHPEMLKTTMESVLNQTHSNLEVWVVDDGSETELYPVIEELNDKRIFYHKLKHTNANVARNYGINKSKGDFIAMLDADDLWLSNHLESCLELLLKEQADGLYGSLFLRNTIIHQEWKFIARSLTENETMIDYLLSAGYGAQTSTLFMTKESAARILWDAGLNRHQDYDFVVRYGKQFKLVVKTDPTVIYTMSADKQQPVDFESCIRVIRNNEEDISPDIYCNYNLKMTNKALAQNASDHIVNHYKKEATVYKEYLSYYQYVNIKHPQNGFEQIKCKLQYVWYILKIRVE